MFETQGKKRNERKANIFSMRNLYYLFTRDCIFANVGRFHSFAPFHTDSNYDRLTTM